jgi:glycosyltransferase involved in cell wall biosynthesis
MIASVTGETPQQLATAVSEGAEDLPNLELLSPRPRAEVLELVANAAAVVLTSRYEGMPNVFLEAWGMGIPVISLHFDPDGRIAEKGLGICAGGSWERFVEASRELWQDARLRREIGERARRYVATTHAPDAVGEQWATAVSDVLS